MPKPLREERAYWYRLIARRLASEIDGGRMEPEVAASIQMAKEALENAADIIQHVRHPALEKRS